MWIDGSSREKMVYLTATTVRGDYSPKQWVDWWGMAVNSVWINRNNKFELFWARTWIAWRSILHSRTNCYFLEFILHATCCCSCCSAALYLHLHLHVHLDSNSNQPLHRQTAVYLVASKSFLNHLYFFSHRIFQVQLIRKIYSPSLRGDITISVTYLFLTANFSSRLAQFSGWLVSWYSTNYPNTVDFVFIANCLFSWN